MTRRSLTRATKTRIFDAAHGICHICNLRILAEGGERWHVEHVKPLWLGGADDETNMAPAHVCCHRGKSAREATVRAKVTASRAAFLGIKVNRYRPLLGTFASGVHKPLNGGPPVWRDSGRRWPRWRPR